MTDGVPVAPWQARIVKTLKELGRWTEDRYQPEPHADQEIVDAQEYRDLAVLHAAVARIRSAKKRSSGFIAKRAAC